MSTIFFFFLLFFDFFLFLRVASSLSFFFFFGFLCFCVFVLSKNGRRFSLCSAELVAETLIGRDAFPRFVSSISPNFWPSVFRRRPQRLVLCFAPGESPQKQQTTTKKEKIFCFFEILLLLGSCRFEIARANHCCRRSSKFLWRHRTSRRQCSTIGL